MPVRIQFSFLYFWETGAKLSPVTAEHVQKEEKEEVPCRAPHATWSSSITGNESTQILKGILFSQSHAFAN